MVQGPTKPLENHGEITKGIVWSPILSLFTVQDRVWSVAKRRVQNTISFVLLQMIFVAQSFSNSLKNSARGDRTTLGDRAGDGTKYHLRHSPSRSVISYRSRFRVSSSIIHHSPRHHAANMCNPQHVWTSRSEVLRFNHVQVLPHRQRHHWPVSRSIKFQAVL